MSREIDMSDPDSWSEDDVLYLRDRDRLPEDFPEPAPRPVLNTALPERNTGDVDTLTATRKSANFDGADDEYKGMTVRELQSELELRELPVSGTKDELIFRLMSDDRQQSEAASEEDDSETVAHFEDDAEGGDGSEGDAKAKRSTSRRTAKKED